MKYDKTFLYDEDNCEIYYQSKEYEQHLDDLSDYKEALELSFNSYFDGFSAEVDLESLEHWVLEIQNCYENLLSEISSDDSKESFENYCYLEGDLSDLKALVDKKDFKNERKIKSLFISFCKIRESIS